jgi:hypothetical protein
LLNYNDFQHALVARGCAPQREVPLNLADVSDSIGQVWVEFARREREYAASDSADVKTEADLIDRSVT